MAETAEIDFSQLQVQIEASASSDPPEASFFGLQLSPSLCVLTCLFTVQAVSYLEPFFLERHRSHWTRAPPLYPH